MRYQDGVSGTVRWCCKQPAQSSCRLHPLFSAGWITRNTSQCIGLAVTPERELGGLPASTKLTCQDLSNRNVQSAKLLADLPRLTPPVLVQVALRLTALQVNRRRLGGSGAGICMPKIDHVTARLQRAHQSDAGKLERGLRLTRCRVGPRCNDAKSEQPQQGEPRVSRACSRYGKLLSSAFNLESHASL